MTEGYKADRDTVVKILNEALATEIVCVLRYKRHYFMATGIYAEGVAAEFLQHANEEQGHADLIAQRIVQLGGEPNFNDSYREMINYVSNDDPTTRRMLEGILAMEEEHADDLVTLLEKIGT